MQKSKIEWTDYTSNPVKGYCPMACSYCYARKMYERFGWDKTIHFDAYEIFKAHRILKPSRIFVGSMIELFGDWMKDGWLEDIFCDIGKCPQHTFQLLTKQPQNLARFSPFPPNVWVGVSATNREQYLNATDSLDGIDAAIKFVSFEPLLEPIAISECQLNAVNWVIIGQQTPSSKKTSPKIEWIMDIVEACDKVRIPVFLKDNLIPVVASCADCGACAKQFKIEGLLLDDNLKLRQEFPCI